MDFTETDLVEQFAQRLVETERITGIYFPGTKLSERFDCSLANFNVPVSIHSLVKKRAGELVQGLRGSRIAHQMPAPFSPRPQWRAANGKEPNLVMNGRETERGELMRYFCIRLNHARNVAGFEPITMSRMGKLLEGMSVDLLYQLKDDCERSDNFSARFWQELKR